MQEMEIRVTANVVAALDARFAKLRRAVPEIVKEEHVYVVWRLGGKCPCCRDVTIVDPVTRKRLENSEIDHNHGPDKSDAQHTWLICRDCNRRFMRKDVARAGGEFEARFKAYQAARERFRFASLLWSEDGYVPEEGR
jgi:hypothetical protein